MKKLTFLFLFCLYFLLPRYAQAATETLQLTTYYPAPSATYNKINLSINAVASNKTAATYCTASNLNAIFTDSTGQLNYCTAATTSAAYCGVTANSGALMVDSTGTLHICINGTSSVYPQQCYNTFCSYDTSAGGTTCATTCAAGFSPQTLPVTDKFQISPNGWIIATACCSS